MFSKFFKKTQPLPPNKRYLYLKRFKTFHSPIISPWHHPKEAILIETMFLIRDGHFGECDFLEFGVFRGAVSISAYHIAQALGLHAMKFYAFDSFCGLPEPRGVDIYHKESHRLKGLFRCSVEEYAENLRESGADLNKFTIIPGWFEETLVGKTKKNLPIKAAAIVYIDCDLYHSTMPVLNFIADYLVDGSIIIIDDWYAFHGNPHRGEQGAFHEWVKNRKINVSRYHDFGIRGTSFIVHKD